MKDFLKGMPLCESFFFEVGQPLLEVHFPKLIYSAGLLGSGSEVLGFDDIVSTDHMWGARFDLFLNVKDLDNFGHKIMKVFGENFPSKFKGYPVHFGKPNLSDNGVRLPSTTSLGNVDPLINFYTPVGFFHDYLGIKDTEKLDLTDWLCIPEHRLLTVRSGEMFHDELNIEIIRSTFDYYPRDVWIWLMASEWNMLAEEEAFVGRCGMVGDDLGSRLVAARQINRMMRLCFYLERQFCPYSKWFGTGFQRLSCARMLSPILTKAMTETDWEGRCQTLAVAYTFIAEKHNALCLTPALDPTTRLFFERPFPVLFADRFSKALVAQIKDTKLSNFPLTGSVTQFTDSYALFDETFVSKKLKLIFR